MGELHDAGGGDHLVGVGPVAGLGREQHQQRARSACHPRRAGWRAASVDERDRALDRGRRAPPRRRPGRRDSRVCPRRASAPVSARRARAVRSPTPQRSLVGTAPAGSAIHHPTRIDLSGGGAAGRPVRPAPWGRSFTNWARAERGPTPGRARCPAPRSPTTPTEDRSRRRQHRRAGHARPRSPCGSTKNISTDVRGRRRTADDAGHDGRERHHRPRPRRQGDGEHRPLPDEARRSAGCRPCASRKKAKMPGDQRRAPCRARPSGSMRSPRPPSRAPVSRRRRRRSSPKPYVVR